MRKWHRYSGIIAAFFLFSLSVTGILLNHPKLFTSSDLPRLTEVIVNPIDSSQIWIGTEKGLYFATKEFQNIQKKQLRIADLEVSDLYFSKDASVFLVSFKEHLIIKSDDQGQTFSQIDLPQKIEEIQSVTKTGEALVVVADGNLYTLKNGQVEAKLNASNKSQFHYLIKKIHTGYIFAPLLIYFNDIAALILIVLICTGIVLFFSRKRR